jgi:hypothetical protein
MSLRTVTTQHDLDSALADASVTDVIIESPRGVWLTVRASGSATVRAYDSATVLAYDSATVRAYGSATVRASGSATVEASGSATVQAGRYVAVHLHSQRVTLSGGVVIDMTAIDRTDPAAWCDLHGVDVEEEDGKARVVKYVDANYRAGHAHTPTDYHPGTTVTAADWDARAKCGGGLHFGPTPYAAKESAWAPLGADARWVLCEVDLADAVGVDDKLKARSCRVLHEIDVRGEPVTR